MIPAGTPLTSPLGLGTDGLVFGCDYNPEQWDKQVWHDDVRLMREAGVNLVAINVFGWSHIEPRRGDFHFDDLDEIIALLAANGIGVNLGTGTSSPPPWLTTLHPEILPQVGDGTTRWPGGRQAWCPSSPMFREHALALAEATALRYGQNAAVKLWHVSNELGCHNALCYCDVSAAAFRGWLERRYVSIEALNEAWGTAFWSQHYAEWAEILPPRDTLSFINPSQQLDFFRFSSDELLDYYRAEAEVIRAVSAIPVTTNFMVTAHIKTQDYWSWAPEMDVVANDHYLDHRLGVPHRELSFSADATRGLAGGRPWLLMEHSTSAVNWQPQNHAKAPGEMMRNSLTHVARGADGVCFFQWRASLRGTEKFHSALLPHSGTDSRVWREVVELGSLMHRLGELAGSVVRSDIALVFSWEAWWATDQDAHPSSELRYLEQVHLAYEGLLAIGATVDIVAPGADLSGYRLVVVPCLYLVSDADAQVITDFVAGGGHAVISFFSGIVDEHDSVRPGSYPGAFRDVAGISTEEFYPLDRAETIRLSGGATAGLWSELLHLRGAEATARYVDGPLTGMPAVTRNEYGTGVARYLATMLDPASLAEELARAASEAGASSLAPVADGIEIVRRSGTEHDYVFVINHTDAETPHPFSGHDLVSEADIAPGGTVAPGGVQIIRQTKEAS
ncbi:beta-galactosidase [Subtercola boreus]|uniref:beta-galactosidase n=1 Tax=Subtercola boreus TaxID=120213 RepID=UPI00209BBEC1|nr:beta-galactosidase [Subtercola boreus]